MKKLTTFAVETVLDLLIHTNGQTSTLEVKNKLRDLGYFAEQNNVRKMVEDIFTINAFEDKYVCQTGSYKTYKFSDDFIADNDQYEYAEDVDNATLIKAGMTVSQNAAGPVGQNGNAAGPVINGSNAAGPVVNTTLKDFHNSQRGIGNSNVTVNTTGNVGTPSNPGAKLQVTSTVSRDPLYIFYTENHAKKSGVNDESWVVSHTNGNGEIQIFDGSLTRDQVRSRYTSILKVKIQDVRASRYKNYK